MSREMDILRKNNFKEPTVEDFPTYIEAYEKDGINAKGPYFEDMHYAWRNRKIKNNG
jgi:hypothetical protein